MKTKPLMALAALALLGSNAHATLWYLGTTLTGDQENPANFSDGYGLAWGTLDDATGALDFDFYFTNLTGLATAAHIHGPADPDQNASVLVPITIPLGVTSGTGSASVVVTPLIASYITSGKTYLNVHSDVYPGGEIRGQIEAQSAVPGPLAALPFLVGAAASRRRRKA